MEFIRYGSLVVQDHDITTYNSFHTPPVEKGFYAFPKGYVEPFLLSGAGAGSVKNGRFTYLRDDKGNKIYCTGKEADEYIVQLCKKNKKYLCRSIRQEVPDIEDTPFEDDDDYEGYYNWIDEHKYPLIIENKPTYFNYNGLIWHHLFEENITKDKYFPHFIKCIRSWVLTDIKTFEKCLKREVGKCKYRHVYGGMPTNPNNRTNYYVEGKYGGYPLNYFDKDTFEVYIEKL